MTTTDIRRLVVTLTIAGGLVLAGCGGGAPAAPATTDLARECDSLMHDAKSELDSWFNNGIGSGQTFTRDAQALEIFNLNKQIVDLGCPTYNTVENVPPYD